MHAYAAKRPGQLFDSGVAHLVYLGPAGAIDPVAARSRALDQGSNDLAVSAAMNQRPAAVRLLKREHALPEQHPAQLLRRSFEQGQWHLQAQVGVQDVGISTGEFGLGGKTATDLDSTIRFNQQARCAR